MSNDLKIKLPVNKDKIDVNDLGEFKWWANHLGIGLEELLSIVKEVGESAQNVRKRLYS